MASIKSKKIVGPDGTTKTVQIGSKADTKYAGMGYKDVDTGIQLPSASSLPNQAGGKTSSNNLNSLLSSSSAARSYNDVEREVKAEMKPGLDREKRAYDMALGGLTKERQDYGRTLSGQLGSNRRFSTSASSFIEKVDNDYKEKIEKLEMQRQDAIESGDARMIGAINSRLQAERAAWREEQDYNIKLFELAQKEEDRQKKEMAEDPFMLAGRTGAIIDLYQQGVDDPAEIFQTINYDESGRQIGDISLDEITTTLSKFENDRDDIEKIVIDLGKSGAPADVIDLVSSSKSLTQAVKNAGDYLQSGSGIVGEYQFYKRDLPAGAVPMSFMAYQDWDANKKRSIAAAGVSNAGYTTAQEKLITSLNENVSKNDAYKKTSSMRGYKDNVLTALSQETGVGDLAAINQFQKVIDEGAVTRDQDVKLIQGSQSLANTIKTKYKKLGEGDQLSPQLRAEMKTAVEAMYEAQIKALDNDPYIKSKQKELERNGIKVEETILGELKSGFSLNKELIDKTINAQSKIENWLGANPGHPDVEGVAKLYESEADDMAVYEWLKLRGNISE